VAGRFIIGRFITEQLYTVKIMSNLLFSITDDTCHLLYYTRYQKNVYVIFVKKISKQNFKIKIVIKSFYTNEIGFPSL